MSTDAPSTPEQPWGAEQPVPPQRPKWSGRKTAAAVAIAVVIAGGGGAAIWAATANDSGNRPGGGPGGPGFGRYGGPGFGQDGGPDGGGQMRDLGPAALADALHGEFVLADGSTDLLQTGKVTAISATSISVTSTDGYAKTYVINGSTRIDNGPNSTDSIKTGDEVTVIAKQTDLSAITVTDRATMTQRVPGQPGQPGQPPQPR
ncbi:MAG TPA: hypothetical protein VGR06_24105 [Actinophytocola sp.]|jgi:hypothetical protein|uniref:hypothetical protein n=1 Tax=Actinophytocola sp. TaxID=1872138 RepID=UPI002E0872C7|nr:hypothetical protein [Actinophytocola sp.]